MARTLQETREWFDETGTTVTDWARAHGFPAATVYALLSGRTRGRRGAAHAAAVALGLKRSVPVHRSRDETRLDAKDSGGGEKP